MSATPPAPASPQPLTMELPGNLPVEYANLVRIAHSPTELVFDFAHILPGVQSVRIQSRIVMSPLAAKLFSRALIENLTRFEAALGEINIPGSHTLADQLFHSPPPEDPETK